MAARTPSKVRRPRRRGLSHNPRDQRPRPTRAEAKQQEDSSEKEKGFLFDPYWDEVFAAYYEPYLRTCCPIR